METIDPMKTAKLMWKHLGLPPQALNSIVLNGSPRTIPSSFKIDELAQAAVGLSALTAALYHSLGQGPSPPQVPKVTVNLQEAYLSFFSERLYRLDGKNPSFTTSIGGLHKTSDGYVRIHDGFPHHADGAVKLVGCPPGSDRAAVAEAVAKWNAIDLETAAANAGLPIYALRTFEGWDATPQSNALPEVPVAVHRVSETSQPRPSQIAAPYPRKCLSGIRVLELSRVIAAPVAGRTLAAHGADVLWVTSPNLPDLPVVDREMARGKRTIQLDLDNSQDLSKLLELAKDADVFIQSYRPGSLAERGLNPKDLAAQSRRDGIVVADLSAFGSKGPWSHRRGFDSLVQTCSGINVAEAEFHIANHGKKPGEPGAPAAVPLPCQALDHGAGYMLATGIMAGLYKRASEGGSWHVEVSLAAVGKYLRSLGRYEPSPDKKDLKHGNFETLADVPEDLLDMVEDHDSGFGRYTHLKHCIAIDGWDVGWEVMPKPLGGDEAVWL